MRKQMKVIELNKKSADELIDELADIVLEHDAKNPNINERITVIGLAEAIRGKIPRWIPVKEKLPEEREDVLFYDIDNDIFLGHWVNDFYDGNAHWYAEGWGDTIKDVIAWQPLPEIIAPNEVKDEKEKKNDEFIKKFDREFDKMVKPFDVSEEPSELEKELAQRPPDCKGQRKPYVKPEILSVFKGGNDEKDISDRAPDSCPYARRL